MFDNASRDKPPQSVSGNENAPEASHRRQYAASNQALHGPDRDPAEHGGRLIE